MTAALTPEQRIEALEAELAILRDSECDKIMAMSETQINALTRMQGSNPEDIAQLGRMTARAAIKDVEINRLRAELAACKRDAERSESEPLHVASIYHLAQTSGISTQRWHNKGDAAVFSTGLSGVAKDDFINVMRRAYELGRADAAPVAAQPQQASKPLSYDEMWDLWNAQANDEMHQQDAIAFASAAITAFCLKNGIKEQG